MPSAESQKLGAATRGATAADVELARHALLEITSADTIGDPAGSIDEGDGVVSVYFSTNLPGYPGWRWTVSVAHLDGGDASVLETELTPGDDALLAPDWVPWVDRLAEYQAAQAAGAFAEDGDNVDPDDDDDDDVDDDDEIDDDEDDDEDDEDDDEVEESDLLHAGDLDGVDIDEVDLDSPGISRAER
ncbi:hypothetical protein GCM10027052_16360 [Parafrigoribacterium mesophilum]|uniref:DUF3027 domain-containing protein n=1 Tax=Parafrigoribacterium mesophilum TaxID=433646 RepID=UPI0031FD2851